MYRTHLDFGPIRARINSHGKQAILTWLAKPEGFRERRACIQEAKNRLAFLVAQGYEIDESQVVENYPDRPLERTKTGGN